MRTTLDIAQGFYVSDALPISSQRCVNFYPSLPQTSTITDANLFSTAGILKLITGDVNSNCRGAHVFAGVAYFVIKNDLVRLNRIVVADLVSFDITVLGTIPGLQRVFMADNGLQMCIVAVPDADTTGNSFIYTLSSTVLVEISDSDFDGPASSVVFSDGYFIFHKSDGKKFFSSNLNNGLAYDALDFNVAEADPDQIRGLGVVNSQLYVFGSETVQIFRNVGRVPSPFVPVVGSTIDIGVVAPQTIIKFGGGLAFVGAGVNESPAIWLIAGGGQKRKISTIAIENELSKLKIDTIPEQVFSWTYAESGAYWLGISLPGTAFVYDLINQRWHERQSILKSDLSRYRCSHLVSAYGLIIAGDTQTGNIGALDEEVFTEYGVLTPRKVVSRPFDNLGNAVNVASLEAVVESGIGLANDITIEAGTTAAGKVIEAEGGADPKIVLSFSDDGGRIFEGFIPRSMGKLGEYNVRPTWSRLGVFNRQRVLQFTVSSPNKATIIKVEADIG